MLDRVPMHFSPARVRITRHRRCVQVQTGDSQVVLHRFLSYGMAIDMTIDSLGFQWDLHDEAPSQLQRFCLRAALMHVLPHDVKTVYDPNVDVALRRRRYSLLEDDAPTLHPDDGTAHPRLKQDEEVRAVHHA